jgi:hypothetical protein
MKKSLEESGMKELQDSNKSVINATEKHTIIKEKYFLDITRYLWSFSSSLE